MFYKYIKVLVYITANETQPSLPLYQCGITIMSNNYRQCLLIYLFSHLPQLKDEISNEITEI